ncbi:MAG: CRTAC1 family protein [Planctomycetota bacterium]
MNARPTVVLAALCSLPAVHGQGFVDKTTALGIGNVPLTTAAYGAGVACADFDGDGDVDLLVPSAAGQPILYFRNDGTQGFTDASATAGLGLSSQPTAVAVADFDNDGDADCVVANWRRPMQFFVNDGTGRFTDQALALGVAQSTSAWSLSFGDYDRDGFVDLYVGNREYQSTSSGEANILFRNLGGSGFTDVAPRAGVDHFGLTYAAPFFDYNEDGWPDLFVANDKGALGVPNTIYANNGDGTFSDAGPNLNASQAIDGMGVDFLDVFCDGGVDVFCTDSPVDHLFLRWNPATGRYVDDTYTFGMTGLGVGWATHWFDSDNDGWQDLFIVHNGSPNQLLRHPGNSAPGPWADVGFPSGLGTFYPQYTATLFDYDNDGRMDIVQRFPVGRGFQSPVGLSVHRNEEPPAHWLKIRTRGTTSNRDGLGARVVVRTGTHTQRQWVRSGTGYLSSRDMRLHFGLGSATVVNSIEVTWPSGQTQLLKQVPTDQILEIVEPSLELVGTPQIGTTVQLQLESPNDVGLPVLFFLSATPSPRTRLPDGRDLPFALDALSAYTLVPGNLLIPSPLATVSATGTATAAVQIPNFIFLRGVRLLATALTLDPQGYPGVRNVPSHPVELLIR